MAESGSVYKVVYSGSIREHLKSICQQAVKVGRGAEVLSAIQKVDHQLQSDPRSFGDPQFRLASAQLQVYLRICPPFLVAYAVHDQRPVVFLRRWILFPEDAIERPA